MAEVIGKISISSSNYYRGNNYLCDKMKKLSPVRASLNVRSPAASGGHVFGGKVEVVGGKQRGVCIQAVAADNAKLMKFNKCPVVQVVQVVRSPDLSKKLPGDRSILMSIGIKKPVRWWEKGLKPNMKEVTGAEDLVDSLLTAGDKLVVVDFFSPGCGGCKALHPKICQLAEMNPDVLFLHVNYEEHKSMCYSLGVHVLPFFRFYRGAHGRLCSFSCTNATIKKFKDALAKHTPDRCSLGPPKGLEEKELLALSSNRDLSFTYTPSPHQPQKTAHAEDKDRTLASSAK